MKTYTDKITQKTISYDDSDLFIIKTRSGKNLKTIKKIFDSENIDQAFNEFYSLLTIIGNQKYLYRVRGSDRTSEGELVLRMRGQANPIPLDDLRMKHKQPKINIQTASIANLTNCPLSLSLEINKEDFSQYPASMTRWTKIKLIYALLAYFTSLTREQKISLLREADKQLIKHKELSGYSIEEENLIKVDVVTKDDLL